MKKAYVEWEDCFSIDRWLPVEQAIELTKDNLACFTVGFIIEDNKSGITLCHTYQSENQVCGVIKIPKKMIKKKIYM